MRTLMITLLSLTLLAACGSAAPADDSTGAASSAPSTAASAAASSAPSTAASPAPASTTVIIGGDSSAGAGDSVEAQALAYLATQINAQPSNLKLQNREETTWNDGSLGCPQPGMMYTQALVPGFKLTYSDGSKEYELHTNADGSTVVWCENGQPQGNVQP